MSRPHKEFSRKPKTVIKLTSWHPDARDEGPRLIPMGNVETVHPTIQRYVDLADRLFKAEKKQKAD
jgi:hypothetical protein